MSQEQQDRASLPGPGGHRGLPGAWPAALIAALAGLLFGAWARTGVQSGARAAPAPSLIAEVAPEDIGGALDTVAGSPDQLARYRERDGCERRLAWVTVARSPGQAAGRIRLQSGGYLSPAFDLGETPVRVALPFPAPYPAGRGTISALGTTADAVVALAPPWHVAAQSGAHAIEVTWRPVAGCSADHR
jgi:hypothetical protein